ncbi:MAG: HAMP domain-containing sensor histidine kinase [Gemmatimonadota bacterium]
MLRRYWPAALAAVAVVVFGSYLAYTQFLSRRIERDVDVMMAVYSHVQQQINSLAGLDSVPAELLPTSPEAQGYLTALAAMQARLQEVGVPIVMFDAAGRVYAWRNVPGLEVTSDPADRAAADAYAEELREKLPANRLVTPVGSIVWGKHPLLRWLDWVPWLQVTGGMLLVLVAVAVIRSDLRAERERLWSAMARELAHQMGTPLSSLAGWIEILRLPEHEAEGMPSRQHIADVVAADVERLERVSRRFELIGKPPDLEEVRLDEVVRELEGYMRPRLPTLGPGIRLRVRVPADLPPIRGNRVLLAWGLENVVKNAVDALAGRGGRILIMADSAGGRVRLAVGDDGPGIDPAVRERIFEPGVTSKSSGWGVGLALARRIVEDVHDGRISVRARRSGGTVFTVSLPVAES